MTMRIRHLFIALFGIFVASAASAQTGVISGKVTDETGAGVPAARVEAFGPLGGVAAAALSADDGEYRLVNLEPGVYTVVISRIGYQQQRLPGIRVNASEVTVASATMTSTAALLNPQVVTVSRTTEKALDAPASVSVVPTERIEDRPVLTPVEHVRGEPGVDVATTGLMQSSTVARGFSNVFSGALLTLTDNRYTSVPSLRVNTPFLIPVTNEDIEKIEIVLGPGAALYGPNSANGVLHIISRSPFTSRGTTLSVGGGERSVFLGSGRHAGVVGETFGYKISGQYMQGDDWEFDDPAEPDTLPGIGVSKRDFKVERWTGEARADWRPGTNTDVIFGVGQASAGNAIELTGIGAAQAKNWNYRYYQGRARYKRLFGQVFLNQSDAGETFLLRTGQKIADESRLYVGQLQHGMGFADRFDFIYGLDVQHTDPRTNGTINGRNEDDDKITEIGGYVHSETRLSPKFNFIAAARVDNHSRLKDPVFSPRAALVFKPVEDQNFRLTYNRAFSTPTSTNLFLDLPVQRLNAQLPYFIRTVGVPEGGLRFRRDCAGGLCVRSPFAADQTAFLASDITGLWVPIVRLLGARGINISQIPAPTAAQVQTVLRKLNTSGIGPPFTSATVADVVDVDELRPTISSTVEGGYKGLLGKRVLLAADVYYEKKTDFVGPLIVETPSVFVDPTSFGTYMATRLTQAYIAAGMPPAQAQARATAEATAMAQAIGPVPLATATPDNPLTNSPDLFLTYRNFGDLDLWGADLAVEALMTDVVSVAATVSFVSKDFFPKSEIGGNSDLALNAPGSKGSLALRYRNQTSGLSGEIRGRYVDDFPMNSGVYIGRVESYTLADINVAYRLPFARGLMLAVNAQNIFDERHREFVGAPTIGRLVIARTQYTF